MWNGVSLRGPHEALSSLPLLLILSALLIVDDLPLSSGSSFHSISIVFGDRHHAQLQLLLMCPSNWQACCWFSLWRKAEPAILFPFQKASHPKWFPSPFPWPSCRFLSISPAPDFNQVCLSFFCLVVFKPVLLSPLLDSSVLFSRLLPCGVNFVLLWLLKCPPGASLPRAVWLSGFQPSFPRGDNLSLLCVSSLPACSSLLKCLTPCPKCHIGSSLTSVCPLKYLPALCCFPEPAWQNHRHLFRHWAGSFSLFLLFLTHFKLFILYWDTAS